MEEAGKESWIPDLVQLKLVDHAHIILVKERAT